MSKSVFEKVSSDKAAKEKRIAELEKKVAELEKEKADAKGAMDEAMQSEDVKAYSRAKASMTAAVDGLEVYGANLKALKEKSLYGDDQKKIIDDLRAELDEYESKIAEEIEPYLEKILTITRPAADEYFKKSLVVEDLAKDAGINSGKPIAWKIRDINRSIGALISKQESSHKLTTE